MPLTQDECSAAAITKTTRRAAFLVYGKILFLAPVTGKNG